MFKFAAIVFAFGLATINCQGAESQDLDSSTTTTTTETTVESTPPAVHHGDHRVERPGEHQGEHRREHHGEHWGEGRDFYGTPLTCDETCDMCSTCTPPPPANTQHEPQREPQSERSATTDNENLGISETPAKVVCSDSPHAHAPFLRSDLAYSVTGVDCAGDLPQPLGETPKVVGRGIASEKLKCGPNAHPMFLRSDLSYSVNHVDCFGDAP